MRIYAINGKKNIKIIYLKSIISKVRGLDDPRKYGSTNPGATNVFRSGDKVAAFLTLLGDVGKGFIIVFFIKNFVSESFLASEQANFISISAISVFLGHLFPEISCSSKRWSMNFKIILLNLHKMNKKIVLTGVSEGYQVHTVHIIIEYNKAHCNQDSFITTTIVAQQVFKV